MITEIPRISSGRKNSPYPTAIWRTTGPTVLGFGAKHGRESESAIIAIGHVEATKIWRGSAYVLRKSSFRSRLRGSHGFGASYCQRRSDSHRCGLWSAHSRCEG